MQRERYKALPGLRCNAQLPSGALRRYCRMPPPPKRSCAVRLNGMGYSARAYDRILRVARTVPGRSEFLLPVLQIRNGGSELRAHAPIFVGEALQYRTLDPF